MAASGLWDMQEYLTRHESKRDPRIDELLRTGVISRDSEGNWQYDWSRMPTIAGTNVRPNDDTGMGIWQPASSSGVVDEGKVIGDDFYGRMTTSDNQVQERGTMDWLGPLLVGGFAGAGMMGLLPGGAGAGVGAAGYGGTTAAGWGLGEEAAALGIGDAFGGGAAAAGAGGGLSPDLLTAIQELGPGASMSDVGSFATGAGNIGDFASWVKPGLDPWNNIAQASNGLVGGGSSNSGGPSLEEEKSMLGVPDTAPGTGGLLSKLPKVFDTVNKLGGLLGGGGVPGAGGDAGGAGGGGGGMGGIPGGGPADGYFMGLLRKYYGLA